MWQKVLGALNSGEMPPEDSQQPGNKEKANFLDDLSRTMVTARKVLSDSGGKITMRRLNKRDYQNSIESLYWGYDSAGNSCPMMAVPATLIRSELPFFSPVTSSSSI